MNKVRPSLVSPQAENVIRESVGVIGRNYQIRHVLVIGLQENIERERRSPVPVRDRFETWGLV